MHAVGVQPHGPWAGAHEKSRKRGGGGRSAWEPETQPDSRSAAEMSNARFTEKVSRDVEMLVSYCP